MKQFLGLFLALAVLLSLGTAFPSQTVGSASLSHVHAAPAGTDSQCPTDAPMKQHCAPSTDPQLNLAQIAPRPDTAGAFGAAPATQRAHSGAPDLRQARAPDLHALSISRT